MMLRQIGRITIAAQDARCGVRELEDSLLALIGEGRERAAQVMVARARTKLEVALKRLVEVEENWPPE